MRITFIRRANFVGAELGLRHVSAEMVMGGAGFEAVLQAVDLLGTAGLSSLWATEPVMAAQMMQGLVRASRRP
ncbi:hypothetical protein M2324_001097 [Rhodovulum sulfidophilum]|nr:hypothetical protein [Rhodovulum sulfidophilum]